jgi:folate-binding protein YgfZ
MNLRTLQADQGAVHAPDGIPLHFGDQLAEYKAALENAVILDRSHEARLLLTGADRLNLMHRMSTNDLLSIPDGAGRPTILTNANARILDRVEVFQLGENALVLGEPGRSAPLRQYLQKHIFFGDDVQLHDLAPSHHQFDLHGPQATTIMTGVIPQADGLPPMSAARTPYDGAPVFIARRKPVSATRWTLIVPQPQAVALWQSLVQNGAAPAGSLVYNVLRVRAGLPSVGRELGTDFIPLELGLWDEVSFSKGCYTGQEIIARMESRGRLAKTLVTLQLSAFVPAPADIFHLGKAVGQLTSSVTAPDGTPLAIGVVRPALAQPGQALTVGEAHTSALVQALAGAQPEFITNEED